MTAVFRAAVIGCGRKGLTIDDERKCPINYCEGPASHAAAFSALPETDLVAVADPDPAARQRAEDRYPGIRAYESWEQLLSTEDVDVVGVATRAPEHAAATVAAAEAGVRLIVCEKAIATSVAEARRMIEACARSHSVLVVDHPRRYHPTYEAAKTAIERGAIGDLRLIFATAGARVVHNGTHFFDLFRFFAGDAVSVSGTVKGVGDEDADGYATVTFESGLVGFLDAQARTEARFVLVGTHGHIEMDGAFAGYVHSAYLAKPEHDDDRWFAGRPCSARSVTHVTVSVDGGTLLATIRDGLACLGNGASPRSSGEDGMRALEIALGVFQSHRANGRAVPLPLNDAGLRIASR